MAIFLGFLKNLVTGEEFVAPMEAGSRSYAERMLMERYPSMAYALLTTYERKELDMILSQMERWPGMPSKVQPKLEELLGHVKVGRGLPPLPQQRMAEQKVDGARIEQVRDMVRGAAPEVQSLAARLLSASLTGTVGSAQPSTASSVEMASDARPQVPTVQVESLPPVQPRVMAQPAASKPSLITMLKAMRS